MTRHPDRTRIKICGVTSVETARAAVEAGADAIGLVLATGSPRSIDHALAERIARSLPPFIAPVRVFRDAPAEDVCAWPGQWLQLHGDEDEAYLKRSRATASPRSIIRGFHFSAEAVRRWGACRHVDALLIDGPRAGSGEAFDHQALAALMPDVTRPVILAGGLTPETVGEAIRTVRPFAVDVSSGVESSPGEKDPALIEAFCQAVRRADASLTG
jgi:phosphoribosylanthranilate isomerase